MTELLLALEATDRGGSVALAVEDRIIELQFEDSDTTHSERLMPTVDRLLDKRNYTYESIDRIAVARGPGSFTAIRLAVTTAKTLAMSCDAELIAPTTLRVMAEYGKGCVGRIRTVLDARRDEFYVQTFERTEETISAITDPSLMSAREIEVKPEEMIVFRGRDKDCSDVFSEGELRSLATRAGSRALVGGLLDLNNIMDPVENPDAVVPNYVRKSDAQRSHNQEDES